MMARTATKEHEPQSVGARTLSDDDLAMEARFNEAHQGILGMLFAAYKMRERKLDARKAFLPLTIIGGFLGSGKTTLLNHLLVAPHGRRLAVLVNDFGRINIDAALVASRTDDMISLANGCACCAVSGDLTNTLIELAEREEPPDAVVLEASGVADPYGIIMAVLTNPLIRVDGSVVVVDAETVQDLAEDPLTKRLFHHQIAAADLVVLSKVDRLDEPGRTAAHDWITANYPNKPLLEAVGGDVLVDAILGIDSKRDLQAEAPTSTVDAHGFASVGFTIDDPLDGERLQALFDTLPASLLRAKGVLNLAEEPSRRTIYQRVGERWGYTPAEPWGDETPRSSLVFIGPAGLLDESALAAGLDACRACAAGQGAGA